MAKHSLKAWIVATRPWSFTASALSVIASLAFLAWAVGGVDWTNGLWAVGAIVLFHAAGNTWSDYCDFRSGVDTAESYGVVTLTQGLFTPVEIRNLSFGLLGFALAAGLALMARTGLLLFWIGLGGLLRTLCYPPLKYRALGDLVILTAYGLLPALGTSFVALGYVEWRVLWMALPVGLLVDAILHANNTRDMRTDRRAAVKTLAHGLGVRGSVALYSFETLFPFAWVVLLVPFGIFPWWSVVVVALLGLALRNSRAMRAFRTEEDAAAIATLDQRSAQLQLLFSLVMTASLLLDTWLR